MLLALSGTPITNSMVVMWIAAGGLALFARRATRAMKQVPDSAQNLLEWMVEHAYGFLEGMLGSDLSDRTFWFFSTAFLFILAANWLSLIPGVGSIGWGAQTARGFVVRQPLFQVAHADINMTLAMALVFCGAFAGWAVRKNGARGESGWMLRILLGVVFLVAGCVGIASIPFRPYANVFAAAPRMRWLVQIPFYLFELLVGLVQALAFTLLTAVFTLLECRHQEAET
jgi:F-type H+-transporting ATPase subunit a